MTLDLEYCRSQVYSNWEIERAQRIPSSPQSLPKRCVFLRPDSVTSAATIRDLPPVSSQAEAFDHGANEARAVARPY
jgi:hypothetical protein